jgi:hypothetical protein
MTDTPELNMSDRPIDLRALDPDLDPSAEERFVSGVMSRIESHGGATSPRMDVLLAIWSLARPVLVAASLVLFATLAMYVRRSERSPRRPATVAEAVGVPAMFLQQFTLPQRRP